MVILLLWRDLSYAGEHYWNILFVTKPVILWLTWDAENDLNRTGIGFNKKKNIFTTMMILVPDYECGRAPGKDYFYFDLDKFLDFLTICDLKRDLWMSTVFQWYWDFLPEIYYLGQPSWDK